MSPVACSQSWVTCATLLFSASLFKSTKIRLLYLASVSQHQVFSVHQNKKSFTELFLREGVNTCAQEKDKCFSLSLVLRVSWYIPMSTCIDFNLRRELNSWPSDSKLLQMEIDRRRQLTYLEDYDKHELFFSGNEKEIICKTRLRTSYSWQVILSRTGHHQAATGCLIKK